jgi:hypothetical protein
MSTQRARRGWSWPRTLAVATLAVFGAVVGMFALPFLVVVLVGESPGGIGMLAGWWLGLSVGIWVGLRLTR